VVFGGVLASSLHIADCHKVKLNERHKTNKNGETLFFIIVINILLRKIYKNNYK
jgi:hypothetical protein